MNEEELLVHLVNFKEIGQIDKIIEPVFKTLSGMYTLLHHNSFQCKRRYIHHFSC